MNFIIYVVVIALAIVAVIIAFLNGYNKGADDQYIDYLENEIKKYEALLEASNSGNMKPISLEELKEIVDDKDNKDGNE